MTGTARPARFDLLLEYLPDIVDAVSTVGDGLRKSAFWALVDALHTPPPPVAGAATVAASTVDDGVDAAVESEVRALRADLALVQAQKDHLAGQLDRLADCLAQHYPGAFCLSQPVVDSAIQILRERWGGNERVFHLSKWLADNMSIEQLRGGEDAVDTAIRLLDEHLRNPAGLAPGAIRRLPAGNGRHDATQPHTDPAGEP